MKKLLYLLLIVLIGCGEKKEEVPEVPKVVRKLATFPTKRIITLDSAALASVKGDLNRFFIEKVPDSSTVNFAVNIKYDGVLLLKRRKNILIDGKGFTLSHLTTGETFPTPIQDSGDIKEFWPSKRSNIAIRGGSNISIVGLKIIGANLAWDSTHGHLKDSQYQKITIPMAAYVSKYEKQHGIDAEGVKNLTISRNNIQKVYGDCIYAGRWSDFTGDWCDTVTITDNYTRFNGRQVVGAVGTRNTLIANNFFDWHRRACIDLEPDDATSGCENIRILNNIIGPGQLLFIASGGAPALIKNVVIDRNVAFHRHLNMTIGPSDSQRVSNKTIPLRVNWQITNNISDTTEAFNSQGASGFINIWFGKDFRIENNIASVTNQTAATMWFFSYNVDTCAIRKKNRFLPTPHKYFIYPTSVRTTFVCNDTTRPVDTVIVKPPVDTIIVTPPVDSNKLIISIYSPVVQPYKVTTSTGSTTLKNGSLSIGENRIELTAYFKRYKTLRVYVGTKYYTVTKP